MGTGKLYTVATPIGNLADFSPRAVEVLQRVDLIAAEDTRHSRHLLQHFAIGTSMISLHAHNEAERSQQLIARLQQGESIALISDAGTPLVSDPGQVLVQQAHAAKLSVVPIPGPCAVIAALSASGLTANQFIFGGFLPSQAGPRQSGLKTFVSESRTVIFYEAPHRIMRLMRDMQVIFGDTRQMVLAKELTKQFEAIITGNAEYILQWLMEDERRQKGEFVVLLEGAKKEKKEGVPQKAVDVLEILLQELPVKQAASLAAKITGEKKNALYQIAVSLSKSSDNY